MPVPSSQNWPFTLCPASVETARDAGVTIHEDAALAESLAQVEIGTAIPEELYPVVAELLVFINRMNQQRGKDKHRGASRPGGRK